MNIVRTPYGMLAYHVLSRVEFHESDPSCYEDCEDSCVIVWTRCHPNDEWREIFNEAANQTAAKEIFFQCVEDSIEWTESISMKR
jgi:hypothetical protein